MIRIHFIVWLLPVLIFQVDSLPSTDFWCELQNYHANSPCKVHMPKKERLFPNCPFFSANSRHLFLKGVYTKRQKNEDRHTDDSFNHHLLEGASTTWAKNMKQQTKHTHLDWCITQLPSHLRQIRRRRRAGILTFLARAWDSRGNGKKNGIFWDEMKITG